MEAQVDKVQGLCYEMAQQGIECTPKEIKVLLPANVCPISTPGFRLNVTSKSNLLFSSCATEGRLRLNTQTRANTNFFMRLWVK